jgi:hypothetical protein
VIAWLRLESSGSWCIPVPNIFVPRLRASVSSSPSITTLPPNGGIKSNTASPGASSDHRATLKSGVANYAFHYRRRRLNASEGSTADYVALQYKKIIKQLQLPVQWKQI